MLFRSVSQSRYIKNSKTNKIKNSPASPFEKENLRTNRDFKGLSPGLNESPLSKKNLKEFKIRFKQEDAVTTSAKTSPQRKANKTKTKASSVEKQTDKLKKTAGLFGDKIRKFNHSFGISGSNLPVNTAGLKSGSPLPQQADRNRMKPNMRTALPGGQAVISKR